MTTPLISVVMPVYNGQEYLNIAIDSLLLQSYKNFELILVDDGSTDHSANLINQYNDKRLRYIYQKNQGLAAALNHGFNEARGRYIARMDCDDISYQKRLEHQVAFLEKNKKVALVGAGYDLIDQDGRIIDRSVHLVRNQDLQLEMLVRNPFGHGTIMLRRQALAKTGLYDTSQPVEDYDLWHRIAQKYSVANLPEQLYGWRVNPSGISHGNMSLRRKQIKKLVDKIWQEDAISPRHYDVKEAAAYYAKLGPKFAEQHTYMIACLYLGLRRRGKYTQAATLRLKAGRLPGLKAAIKDLGNQPGSHNYNLEYIRR